MCRSRLRSVEVQCQAVWFRFRVTCRRTAAASWSTCRTVSRTSRTRFRFTWAFASTTPTIDDPWWCEPTAATATGATRSARAATRSTRALTSTCSSWSSRTSSRSPSTVSISPRSDTATRSPRPTMSASAATCKSTRLEPSRRSTIPYFFLFIKS